MTETPAQSTLENEEEQAIDQSNRPDREPTPTSGNGGGSDTAGRLEPESETVRQYLAWGALGVCSLLAVFALIQFYGSVTDAIELWVDPRYQPVIGAAFNLAVLLASLIGVSLVLRELN